MKVFKFSRDNSEMGGFGSGRFGKRSTRLTDDELLRISVHRWGSKNLLVPETTFETRWRGRSDARLLVSPSASSLTLALEQRGSESRQTVSLERTPCHFGGSMPWFLCPNPGCGRRASILYVGERGDFACRLCWDLAYRSQRENERERAGRRAQRIRQKFRPRMQGRTIARLERKLVRYEKVAGGELPTRGL